jgi:filamentous hemagglutinin
MFTEIQLAQIKSGSDKIKGYTWHHHRDVGRMQLVPKQIHKDTGHVGGFEMWGGKK